MITMATMRIVVIESGHCMKVFQSIFYYTLVNVSNLFSMYLATHYIFIVIDGYISHL